jgi:DNA invertase Pin-like site-specific DNA recombinase
MLLGYARVSREDQNLDLQKDALVQAGVERLWEDKASGARDDRPGLAAALSHAREGDCLVVWRLDRLGRSLRALIDLVEELRERGIDFRSVTEGIDTTTVAGRFFFHVLAALAQMERELIRERTHAGLAAARARGRKGGRKPKLNAKQIAHARKLLEDRNVTIKDVAASLGVNRSTIYRALGLGSNSAPTPSAPTEKSSITWRPPPEWRDRTSEMSRQTLTIIGAPRPAPPKASASSDRKDTPR